MNHFDIKVKYDVVEREIVLWLEQRCSKSSYTDNWSMLTLKRFIESLSQKRNQK